MPDTIKPTSVEGYLIRLYDKVEALDSRMSGMESRLTELTTNEREFKEICDGRIKEVEAKMIRGEGSQDVKSSMTPYLIAFISCVLTILSYVLLHLVGIK